MEGSTFKKYNAIQSIRRVCEKILQTLVAKEDQLSEIEKEELLQMISNDIDLSGVAKEETVLALQEDVNSVKNALSTLGSDVNELKQTVANIVSAIDELDVPRKCQHEYDEGIVTTPATCTDTGVKTFTCTKCGSTYTEEIPAMGHTFEAAEPISWVETNSTGGVEFTTADNITWEAINDFSGSGTWTITIPEEYPTIENAYFYFNNRHTPASAAMVPGIRFNGNEIGNTLTYDNGMWKVLLTGLGPGTNTLRYEFGSITEDDNYTRTKVVLPIISGMHKCSVCGFVSSHEYEFVETIPPTCTESGYDVYKCAGDGDTITKNYVDALGHQYEGSITTPATCTNAGIKTFTCVRCGNSYTEEIPATGHNYVDDICVNCGKEISELDLNWQYTITSDNRVRLDKYIGSEIDVQVKPSYSVDGTTYSTAICASTFESNKTITTVNFTGPVTVSGGSIEKLFYMCNKLTAITGLNNINTSGVTTMSSVFMGCSKLTNLDVSSWDTSSVQTCQAIFANCTALTSVNAAGLVGQSVTSIATVFAFDSNLTSLDLRTWDTSGVTNMNALFRGCTKLTSIKVTRNKWVIGSNCTTNTMFQDCGCSEVTYA